MAKKKTVKKASKKIVKKKAVAKKNSVAKKTVNPKAKPKMVRASINKLNLVLKNIFSFLILFIISFVLYTVSVKEIYQETFFIFSILFGFIVLAFVLVLLVLYFLRVLRR